MMPTITVSEQTYRMLQSLAEPFVDDPESVIARLARNALERPGEAETSSLSAPGSELALNPANPPSLAHTKLLSARIEGKALERPNWNKLMRQMHLVARKKLVSFEAVKTATAANIVQGRLEERGFEFVRGADLSVQGIEANLAWSHTYRLAEAVGAALMVEFEWRSKEGAVHPGRRARMDWSPGANS